MTATPAFVQLPDLASRRLGGSVVAANDELFAEKENLIKPSAPAFSTSSYGHKGKVYDGWETRRRREPGHDYAIVRLGAPGIVRGIVVDTSFFTGNYPPEISVEGVAAAGYSSPDELDSMNWQSLIGRAAARGDAANFYPVASESRWTHVRLSIYPDGGVARLRVHGLPVPDPAFLTGTIDLAAVHNGGHVTDCSDAFYGAPGNLLMPGLAGNMADGWENARRRDDGHDFVAFQLAGAGIVRRIEIDTSYFVGNAPGAARVLGAAAEAGDPDGAPVAAGAVWRELLPRTRLLPDTPHRFLISDTEPVSSVRLEVFPDGGVARFRVFGELTGTALARLKARYESAR